MNPHCFRGNAGSIIPIMPAFLKPSLPGLQLGSPLWLLPSPQTQNTRGPKARSRCPAPRSFIQLKAPGAICTSATFTCVSSPTFFPGLQILHLPLLPSQLCPDLSKVSWSPQTCSSQCSLQSKSAQNKALGSPLIPWFISQPHPICPQFLSVLESSHFFPPPKASRGV